MKRLVLWLAIVALSVGGVFLVIKWVTKPHHTTNVQIEKPSKQEKEAKELRQMAEARFVEQTRKMTFTQMLPSEQGWILAIAVESHIINKSDLLNMLLDLLDELQKTEVDIAEVGIHVYSDALRDPLGRLISDLLIARMQVGKPTLAAAEWRHVQHKNMPTVLDELWINPILQEEETESRPTSDKAS